MTHTDTQRPGSFYVINQVRSDEVIYQQCCRRSTKLCGKFYRSFRPISSCAGFEVPQGGKQHMKLEQFKGIQFLKEAIPSILVVLVTS